MLNMNKINELKELRQREINDKRNEEIVENIKSAEWRIQDKILSGENKITFSIKGEYINLECAEKIAEHFKLIGVKVKLKKPYNIYFETFMDLFIDINFSDNNLYKLIITV